MGWGGAESNTHKVLFLLLKFLTACELGRLSKISIFIINSGP